MAVEHSDLVCEMASLEKMQMSERLKLAKKRRAIQLKTYIQYEKQLEKESSKKGRKQLNSSGSNSSKAGLGRLSSRLRFEESILLLDAASRNDLDEVGNLLKAGVSPDVCNEDGLTALHQCSIDNLEEMMKLLTEHGADVSRPDSELWTPLHAAATCGHVRICKYLCDHGANLLAVNTDGNMPYDLCEDVTTLDYIESEMARRGVTQELIDQTRLSTENQMLADIKQMIKNGGNLNSQGSCGETLLHIAACNGYFLVTEFLISHRASLSVKDRDDWQPLHCAVCWGQLAIVELLLENGADYEARTKNGESALDLCEDVEMKQRVLEIIEDVERKQPHKHRDNLTPRRNSTAARRGSAVTTLAMRRSSVHEKTSIAQKEAQLEALRLREPILFQEDDDEDETVIDAITLHQTRTGEVVDVKDVMPTVIVTPPEPKQESKPLKPIISSTSKYDNTNRKSNALKDASSQEKHAEILGKELNSRNPGSMSASSSRVQGLDENAANSSNLPKSANTVAKHQSLNGSADTNARSSDKQQRISSVDTSGSSKMKTAAGAASTNGSSAAAPPSGTLAELKRQRAKRMSEALSVLTSNESSLPNGSCNEPGRGSSLTPEEIREGTSRQKCSSKHQVLHGSGKKSGCCLLM